MMLLITLFKKVVITFVVILLNSYFIDASQQHFQNQDQINSPVTSERGGGPELLTQFDPEGHDKDQEGKDHDQEISIPHVSSTDFLIPHDDGRNYQNDQNYRQNPSHRHRFSSKYSSISDKNERKKNSQSGILYTKWSKWSRCSRHCQQTRRRRCKIASLCGTALIKEKRSCVGWRCQHEKIHTVPPDEIQQYPTDIKPAARADVRLLLNYNSMFYTNWSNWSLCSLSCLTSRYRSCRYPLFCGNAIIREEAFCYLTHSSCHQWYIINKLGSKTREPTTYFNPESSSQFGSRSSITTNSSSLHDQVIFGRNKYFTENSPISPEDSVHILSENVGRHRFSGRDHAQKVDVYSSPLSLNKNNEDYSNILSTYGKTNIHQWLPSLDIYRPKITDVTSTTTSGFNKQDSIKISHYPSLGREVDILPEKCGKSNVKKPSWHLKIIGGRESTPHKWPWQVAILNRAKEVFCGGTLIAPQWVITAAHCLRKRLYIRLAEHDLAIKEGPEVQFKITETIEHPLYDSTTVDNDVALLRLPEPIEVGISMAPVCLPSQGSPLPVAKKCTIIGWGKERHSHYYGTEVLNEAEVPVIDEDLCRRVYADYYITQNMFCAGHLKGRIDSCAGDSGGPLLCHQDGRWYIYGITSFGEGCGRRGKFGIYAKVSNYRMWINDVMAAHSHRKKKYVVKISKKKRRRHVRNNHQRRRERRRGERY